MSRKAKKAKNARKAAAPKKLNAGLNVAQASKDTWNHWAFVRPETPAGTVRPKDRAEARTKAREEYLNNPYASGFADTFALYLVGTGPRLRFKGSGPETDPAIIREVELLWRDWTDSVRLAKTLRLGVKSLVVDGEMFLLESANPKRKIWGVNYQVLDPQRIGNPNGKPWTPRQQDGLFFDEFGNLEAFCVYDVPEYDCSYYDSGRYKIVTAENVHYTYKENLPETTRGWSWFAPVLESMGRLRDYEDGVIEAAKSAANTFATIETQSGFVDGNSALTIGEDTDYYSWQCHTPQRNKIIQLPPETTLKAFQPAQPTTNVPEFISQQVARLGRGMGLTRNRATGSSHEYNFSSGKLDSQPFEMLIQCLQRDLLELDVMDKLFGDFYVGIRPRLLMKYGEQVADLEDTDWAWRWPKPPLVDEEAQARADAIRVKSYQATVREIWEERHPDSRFEDVKAEIDADRKAYPEIYGAAEEHGGVAPPAEGTRIDEPKAPEIGKQRGEE